MYAYAGIIHSLLGFDFGKGVEFYTEAQKLGLDNNFRDTISNNYNFHLKYCIIQNNLTTVEYWEILSKVNE